MTVVRVTRTVLVQEVIEYATNIPLSLPSQEVEDGESFSIDAFLIEKEIHSQEHKVVDRMNISKPQIIKIETI